MKTYTDSQILSQLETVAHEVFALYANKFYQYIPENGITLSELMNKETDKNYSVARLINDKYFSDFHKKNKRNYSVSQDTPNYYDTCCSAYRNWLDSLGMMVNINIDGYSMKFPRWEAINILYRFANAYHVTGSMKRFYLAA